MTALTKYARLEATALWRAAADAQRREVIVSIGEATLVIHDTRTDRPLTHWSLAAIERLSTSGPAIFHPDGDPSETLEFGDSETEMIEAIDTLRRAVARARPHPGRLRWLGGAVIAAVAVGLAVFWLPGALRDHALRVLPEVKKADLSAALTARIERVSGTICAAPGTATALRLLAGRTGTTRVAVLPGGISETLILPDGTVLVHRKLVEDHEDPHVVAGYILAEQARLSPDHALRDLLLTAGLRGTATLLTTGRMPEPHLDAHAETLLGASRDPVPPADLTARFGQARLAVAPYTRAAALPEDIAVPLIATDPMAGQPPEPIMPDADWVRLQQICAG